MHDFMPDVAHGQTFGAGALTAGAAKTLPGVVRSLAIAACICGSVHFADFFCLTLCRTMRVMRVEGKGSVWGNFTG